MWLFEGLLKKIFQIASADTRALVQSTFAFTILNGGNQTNIIPNQVEANINVRVAPFDTIESIIEHVKKVIDDDQIEVTSFDERRTYKECSTDQEGYRIIRSTVYETYDNVVVAPFIMLGGTDAKYYCNVSPCVIRFSPMKVTNEDRKGIHGLDEQIKVESLLKCQEFYQRLLKKI
jgi:carboxypeptidase PM20D1